LGRWPFSVKVLFSRREIYGMSVIWLCHPNNHFPVFCNFFLPFRVLWSRREPSLFIFKMHNFLKHPDSTQFPGARQFSKLGFSDCTSKGPSLLHDHVIGIFVYQVLLLLGGLPCGGSRYLRGVSPSGPLPPLWTLISIACPFFFLQCCRVPVSGTHFNFWALF